MTTHHDLWCKDCQVRGELEMVGGGYVHRSAVPDLLKCIPALLQLPFEAAGDVVLDDVKIPLMWLRVHRGHDITAVNEYGDPLT